MDIDTLESYDPPIPSLSSSIISQASELSVQGLEIAELAYGLIYSASGGRVCLREKDQILPTVSLQLGHDTLISAGTGSGKTLQILTAALLNPGKIILVLSPLLKLQNTMVISDSVTVDMYSHHYMNRSDKSIVLEASRPSLLTHRCAIAQLHGRYVFTGILSLSLFPVLTSSRPLKVAHITCF